MINIKNITKISMILVFGLLVTKAYSRNLDGTGPQGLGPKTGHEQGDCENRNPKNKILGLGRNSKTGQGLGRRQGLGKTETRNGGLGLGIDRNKNLSSQKKLEALELHKDVVQNEIDNLNSKKHLMLVNLK